MSKQISTSISTEPFGRSGRGEQAHLWRLSSGALSVELMDYGATLRSVCWDGLEVCLGLESLRAYEQQQAYIGVICGRFANRIVNARFDLDGETCKISANNPPHSLHGGERGFSRRLWEVEVLSTGESPALAFRRVSPHKEDGYPGNLRVEVIYQLSREGDIIIYYRAECDAPTVVNLTNHAYWNLEGEDAGDIRGHEIMIAADSYVELDAASLPTGRLVEAKAAMDLRRSVLLGERMGAGTGLPEGFDHCYVLNAQAPLLQGGGWGQEFSERWAKLKPRLAARVEASGRAMEVYTSYPGIQFYTSRYLDEKAGRGGLDFKPLSAFCLESQFLPDSPNQPTFPNTILRPGQVYEQITVHRFTMETHPPSR